MMLIAQNHLQLILEVGAMLFVTLVFCLNLIPLSLSVVTFLSLFLAGGFTLLFGADILLLIISSSTDLSKLDLPRLAAYVLFFD